MPPEPENFTGGVSMPFGETDASTRAPIVGRTTEVESLDSALNAVTENRGQSIAITGVPGIGKSHLISLLKDEASARGARVIGFICTNLARTTPLWPWRELLNQLPESDEIVRSLEIDLPDPVDPESTELSESRKFLLFTDVVAKLRARSKETPLAIIVDDLQWADSTSQELFAFAAGQIRHDSILLAAGVRTPDSIINPITNSVLSELGRLGNYSRIEPSPLTPVEAHQLVESLVGHSVTREVVTQITDRSNGVPLFIREMAQLVDHRGQYLSAEIPEVISEILGSNFTRLSSDARSVLSAAAVLGGTFDAEDINTVLGNTPVFSGERLTTERFIAAIDEASTAGIIRAEPSGSIQFGHPLYADVARDAVPTGERVLMHNQAGQLLEGKHGINSAAYASELAWHYGHATSIVGTEKVVAYSIIAGQSAIRSFAWAEALEHFENVRRILGDTSNRIELAYAWLGIGRARHAAYQSKWGNKLSASEIEDGLAIAFNIFLENGETELAIEAASQGIVGHPGWAPHSSTVDRALDLAEDDSARTAKLLTRYADVLFNDPRRAGECWAVFDRAFDMAVTHGDLNLQLNILRIQAQFKRFESRHKDVLELRDRALPLIAALPHSTDSALIHIFAGTAEAALGDINTGERSLNIGHQISSLMGIELAAFHLGGINIELARGRFTNAVDHARELQRLTEDVMAIEFFELVAEAYTGDIRSTLSTCLETIRNAEALPYKLLIQALYGNLAVWIARHIGDSEVVRELTKVSDALSQVPATDPTTATLTKQLKNKLAAASNDPNLALSQYKEMEHFAGTFDMEAGGFPVDILRGDLLRTCGEEDQALKAYAEAFTLSKNSGNIVGECEAAHAYATALIDRDNRIDTAEAIVVLKHGIAVAESSGMNYLLTAMNDLLEIVSSGKRIFPAGLTEREVDVIRLVAAGMSNPEIGEELFISLNTVLRHVSNIFGKLGVSNRTEAGIKAVELGVVEKA